MPQQTGQLMSVEQMACYSAKRASQPNGGGGGDCGHTPITASCSAAGRDLRINGEEKMQVQSSNTVTHRRGCQSDGHNSRQSLSVGTAFVWADVSVHRANYSALIVDLKVEMSTEALCADCFAWKKRACQEDQAIRGTLCSRSPQFQITRQVNETEACVSSRTHKSIHTPSHRQMWYRTCLFTRPRARGMVFRPLSHSLAVRSIPLAAKML